LVSTTPFTNLSFDLLPSPPLKDEAVIVGGTPLESTYAEFQKEMNMLNRAFCEIMIEGDAKGRIFTFPIPTYSITRDFDWQGEEQKALWEMTAKYGIPYFANFVNSDMNPEDTRSMCCRLRLDTSEIRRRGGGLFGSNPLTGSIGVVTINMPRIGFLSNNEQDFFARLGKLMSLARESLEIKRKTMEMFTEDGLYPYSKFYLSMVKKRFGSYWTNHFSTIGLIGMNEACWNFLGKDISTGEGKDLAVKVLAFMRETLARFQEETGGLYNHGSHAWRGRLLPPGET
jgi:Oxygen-sensitive ribonucleoside-triphosphate reductase